MRLVISLEEIDTVIDEAVHGVFNDRPEHNASDGHEPPLDKRELGEMD
jgi:hypothetical protein